MIPDCVGSGLTWTPNITRVHPWCERYPSFVLKHTTQGLNIDSQFYLSKSKLPTISRYFENQIAQNLAKQMCGVYFRKSVENRRNFAGNRRKKTCCQKLRNNVISIENETKTNKQINADKILAKKLCMQLWTCPEHHQLALSHIHVLVFPIPGPQFPSDPGGIWTFGWVCCATPCLYTSGCVMPGGQRPGRTTVWPQSQPEFESLVTAFSVS